MSKVCPVCGTSYSDANAFCPADGTTLRAANVEADLVGSVIADRYLVTDLLGEGGMGKVYLARHVRLPQQAAIKVLHSDQLRDAASVARFNREAANASRIDNDRVARVYDFGETDDGMVYLAMEYVPGRTLKRILVDGGALPPRRTALLVRQIADALDAAHRMGIVHRDLKPDNVMVVEEHDGTDRVKVVDFGIAKALGADEGGHGLTKTGYVVGTPEFMSPEQLLGGPLDARSDVYALALVAYQCLTATLPFDMSTPERGMTARLIEPPRRLYDVSPDVPWPADVQAAFDAALDREPANRPPTAGAFARTLSAAIDAWDPPTPGARAIVTPAVGAPAVGAPIGHPPPTSTAETDRPAPSPPRAPLAAGPAPAPGRRSAAAMVTAGLALALLLGAGAYYVKSRGDQPPAVDTTTGAGAAGPSTAPPDSARPGRDTLLLADGGQAPAATAPAVTTPPVTPPPVAPSGPTSGGTAPAAGTATRPAATRPPVARPASPVDAGATPTTADGAAARRTLDSITRALDAPATDEEGARAAAAELRRIIPRLTNATETFWAHVRLVEAYALAGNTGQACTALQTARSLARTGEQQEAVRRYVGQLGCGS